MTAAEQGAAFVALSAVLDDVYGAAADRPRLVGPDTHSFHDAGSATAKVVLYLQDFARAAGPVLHAVTHHEYIEITADNVLDPKFLDLSAAIARDMVAAVRAVSPTLGVWAGEIGPHNGGTYGPGGVVPDCSGNHVCGRYGSAIWYADSMAAKAAAGYEAYNRQDAVGADYGLLNSTTLLPTPDYWLLRVWSAAVGARALAVAAPAGAPSLRAYAFCARNSSAAAPAVALLLINLNAAAPACAAAPAWAAAGARAAAYVLTPGGGAGAAAVTDAGARLNGAPLALDAAGRVPPVAPASAVLDGGLVVPPLGVAFFVVPAAPGAAPACEV